MPGGKMSGYKPGIPTQPYTKWDADKDEVEVDYKRLDPGHHSCFSGRKGCVLKILMVIVIFSLGLIFGYIIRRSVHEYIVSPNRCPFSPAYEGYSRDVSEEVRRHISAASLERNLRQYTKDVHMTGTKANNALGNLLKEQLQGFGLKVKTPHYNVLLSYPEWEDRNTVYLLRENGTEAFRTEYKVPHPYAHPELAAYSAFSPNGTAEGELVYANYGRRSDMDLVLQHLPNNTCEGHVIIMRYGAVSKAEKVLAAQECGAVGVLLYADPAEYTHHSKVLYPQTKWLPGWAVQSGTVNPVTGDLLTPNLPATDGMFRLSEADLPLDVNIPVQPISYDDATVLLSHMRGATQNNFQGSLATNVNVTYKIGPGYDKPRQNWRVRMEVQNELERRNITNILGVIEGAHEPDRVVILGSHYDSWTFGAMDPGSGTAILTEVAKALGYMTQKGWRPRRTIVIAHWDAEEQGLLGSWEWVQEHEKELAEQVVALINVDGAVAGNYTLSVQASPLLRGTIASAAREVPLPRPEGEEGPGRAETLWDQWAQRMPDDNTRSKPSIHHVGSGSDSEPFIYMLGVPAVWPRYTVNPEESRSSAEFPGYHSALDNFNTTKRFLDPNFTAHKTLSEVVAELVLMLSSSSKLPFDCRDMSRTLQEEYDSVSSTLNHPELNSPKHFSLDWLLWAVDNFTESCLRFTEEFDKTSHTEVLKVRRMNDQLMQVSRAFIHPGGLPGRPNHRNVLFAPSVVASPFQGSTFTGIRDAYSTYTNTYKSKTETERQAMQHDVEYQISVVTQAVRAADHALSRALV